MNQEHINEEGLCYCGSLDCLGNLRVMLNKATEQVISLEAKYDQAMADWAKSDTVKALHVGNLESKLDRIKTELQAYADQGDLDPDESTLHQFLVDEFELNLFEEKTVVFEIQVSATVKAPKDADINEYDFNLDDVSISVADNDWDIEIDDYSFNDVSEA